jgi:hypothetical protein
MSTTDKQEKKRRYANCEITTRFAFLLTSLSRPALRLARRFIPLPSERTLYNCYHRRLEAAAANLINLALVDQQVQMFIEANRLPDNSVISVAIDAMAMNSDRSTLPASEADYVFVIFAQPVERHFHCLPIHVIQHDSGQSTPDVRNAMAIVCDSLSRHGCIVKYNCADGDRGYNEMHLRFFLEWYPILQQRGLAEAVDFVSHSSNVPVGDFLHLWKNFCNKVKNHSVVLCPGSLLNAVTVDELQSLLTLGQVLKDKSPTGRMRDSYALQLFTLSNCLKCLQNQNMMAFMYLLPWSLQEEVIRSPLLSRQERLNKAVISFKLLLHYYHLCSLPHAEGISQRFSSKTTKAVTFAENSVWPRILNSAIALIQFVLDATENSSFSRLGTHCLENFFGFVRRNSYGDDRFSPSLRIIAKATVVYQVMQELGLEMKHNGRDNIGGTVLRGDEAALSEDIADVLTHSLIHLAHLDTDAMDESELMSADRIERIVEAWTRDNHHANDPVCKVPSSPVSNCRITARNMGC